MTTGEQRLSSLGCDVTLIGGGTMGSALLVGWLAAGLDPGRVRIVDPRPSPALHGIAAQAALTVRPVLDRVAAGVIVLAVKPQAIGSVADAAAPFVGADCIVLSIMAGITLDRLRACFPAAEAIVRAMPNLAASVGRGATIVVPERSLGPSGRTIIERLLGVSGTVEWLHGEELMDAGTALSGSGPAYLFYVAECLARAGERAGLPGDMAARLARQTVAGAGALLTRSSKSAAELREDVTSPGGTTQAGMAVLLEEQRMAATFEAAVAAAAARSRELALEQAARGMEAAAPTRTAGAI